MQHGSQSQALESHHLAANQISAVKILVVALRQLAAQHAHLGAPQSLRLVSILDSREFHGQRPATAAAGLDAVVLPDTSLADAQTSMVEKAFGRIGVRT